MIIESNELYLSTLYNKATGSFYKCINLEENEFLRKEIEGPLELISLRHTDIDLAFSHITKSLLYGGVFMILAFNSCQIKSKENGSRVIKKNISFTNPLFDNVLKSLNKNYVVNFDESNRNYLLNFYKITDEDFKRDSAEYYNSVHSFYKCDSSIIIYLLRKYKGDTAVCSWVYSHHPHSSTIKRWEEKFTNEQGAVVLIYDYLLYRIDNPEESITTFPDRIEKIINRINLDRLEEWLSKMKQMSLSDLRKQFKNDFFPN